jgi:hypothetical protein
MHVDDCRGCDLLNGDQFRWIHVVNAQILGGQIQVPLAVDPDSAGLVQMSANRGVALGHGVRGPIWQEAIAHEFPLLLPVQIHAPENEAVFADRKKRPILAKDERLFNSTRRLEART